jgi:hypothetical protein
MAKKLASPSGRWVFWKWFKIMDKENPEEIYLKRLRFIQTPYFGIYVHWINRPDNDRGPHNHPWPFTSFILRGGYSEDLYRQPMFRTGEVQHRTWGRFSLHSVALSAAHRITSAKPGTISVIFMGKRSCDWGFYINEPDGVRFYNWEVYDKDSGQEIE